MHSQSLAPLRGQVSTKSPNAPVGHEYPVKPLHHLPQCVRHNALNPPRAMSAHPWTQLMCNHYAGAPSVPYAIPVVRYYEVGAKSVHKCRRLPSFAPCPPQECRHLHPNGHPLRPPPAQPRRERFQLYARQFGVVVPKQFQRSSAPRQGYHATPPFQRPNNGRCPCAMPKAPVQCCDQYSASARQVHFALIVNGCFSMFRRKVNSVPSSPNSTLMSTPLIQSTKIIFALRMLFPSHPYVPQAVR